MPKPRRLLVPTVASGLLAGAVVGLAPSPALADTAVIKRPGAHPDYIFEAEPHFLLGIADPPGVIDDDDVGVGVGFRGSIEIVDNGFVSSINNTVAIGFGFDFVHYDGGGCYFRDRRDRRGRICVDDDTNVFWLPVVLQWNFWLTRNWSVFGEPGFALRIDDNNRDGDSDLGFDPIVFYAGGRFHFNERITLTMRMGWPTFSVGVSFLL